MLRRIDSRYVHRMDPQDLDDLTNSCQDPDQYNKRGGFIFPGNNKTITRQFETNFEKYHSSLLAK